MIMADTTNTNPATTATTTTLATLATLELLQSFKEFQDIDYANFKSADVVYIDQEKYSCAHNEPTIFIVKSGMVCNITNSMNHDIIIVVEKKAFLQYHSVISGVNSNPNYKNIVVAMQNAKVDWIDASFGKFVDIKHSIVLKESGSEAKYRSMFLASREEKYKINVEVIHVANNTNSSLFTRTALFEKSNGSYRGKIKILPDAYNCSAKLREDSLVLGIGVHIDAIPILEIANADVKCSHGVTITQVSDDQLFYLQARGILQTEAKKMLIAGFFDQMLISMGDFGLNIKDHTMKKLLDENLEENL